jgi:AdoMet-dependent rRNA methyltransferase SPB1
VAAKTLPVGSTIVGVDLDKIRAIAGVKTLVGDITTPATAAALKRAGNGVAYDAVLHDGAPNVGGAWASEAYSQVRREMEREGVPGA